MHQRLAVILFLIASTAWAQSTMLDTDGDGMTDQYEDANGLNRTDPDDALADADGDKVPNLWEASRGYPSTPGSSRPDWDAIVDPFAPYGGTAITEQGNKVPVFREMAHVTNHYSFWLPSYPDWKPYRIVRVKHGLLRPTVTRTFVPIGIAWIADTAAEAILVPVEPDSPIDMGPNIRLDKATGLEAATFAMDATDGNACTVIERPMVFANFVFEGSRQFSIGGSGDGPTSQYLRQSLFTVRNPYESGAFPVSCPTSARVRLENCIIRDWNPVIARQSAGTLRIESGHLELVHCTVWNSNAWIGESNDDTFPSVAIENSGGTCRIVNSIVWSPNTNVFGALSGYNTSIVSSVVQASNTVGGATLPLLTKKGHLRLDSYECLGKALPNQCSKDIFGNTRTVSVDLGAEEWRSLDGDSLPDWWERFWFGATTASAATYLATYQLDDRPVTDQDNDGLGDSWETSWGDSAPPSRAAHLRVLTRFGNPDYDGRKNWEEMRDGQCPFTMDADADLDGDGIHDSWELSWPGITSLTQLQKTGDFDRDGFSDWQEFRRDWNRDNLVDERDDVWFASYLTWNPTQHWDADHDQLPDDWERAVFINTDELPGGDYDRDGHSNAMEFANQTAANEMDPLADLDHDGLSDYWEIAYFRKIERENGFGNPDGDGRNNALEFRDGTNPNMKDRGFDQDNDLMDDWWEEMYFGGTADEEPGRAGDNPDNDGLSNLEEFRIYDRTLSHSSPWIVHPDADVDGDGIKDWWEIMYFSTIQACAPGDNPDSDGLDNHNLGEFQRRTHPLFAPPGYDGDADGIEDNWERQYFGNMSPSTTSDFGEDAVRDRLEYLMGLNPKVAEPFDTVMAVDLDRDSLPDFAEYSVFGNLGESALGDFDGDGVPNGIELMVLGTRPDAADSDSDGLPDFVEWIMGWTTTTQDSDGDGIPDQLDLLPHDPLAGSASALITLPGAPVLTLHSPPGAVLISTVIP